MPLNQFKNISLNVENYGQVELVNYISLSDEQALDVLHMRNHPEVRRWMHDTREITKSEHFGFIDKLRSSEDKLYFLVMFEGGKVGVVYLTDIEREVSSCELGLFANLEADLSGKGRLLMFCIIWLAEKKLKLNLLTLEVFASNRRAIKLYERFGFVYDKHVFKNGQDVVRMSLSLRD